MTDQERSLLMHGSPQPLPPRQLLRAGPLTLVFEAGDLRTLTLGGREIVRRIYGAVRDREWRTIPGTLSGLRVATGADRFLVRYRSEHREDRIHFTWDAAIEGFPDGTVVFDFSGQAVSSFDRNRIGLCVLHPIRGHAGTAALARRADGTTSEVRFPDLVAVEQPIRGFSNLSGLTCADGAVEILLEGDVFETEDQRNWIDASYKTYSTPLSVPRPVRVAAGTRVEQRVTVRVQPRAAGTLSRPCLREDRASPPAAPVSSHRMPAIGIGPSAGPMWPSVASRLEPAHVRIDVDFTDSHWRPRASAAVSVMRSVRSAVELGLVVDASAREPLDILLREWPADLRLARVLVLSSGGPTTRADAHELVRTAFARHPDVPIAAGSRGDLYEFHLFPPPAADVLFWSMNPQAHASDVTSLTETPEAAGDQVRSVRQRHPRAAIAISPVTLRPRTSPAALEHPVQRSLLAASWTLAMAAQLAHAGAASITFFESTADMISLAGVPYPLFHVIADLCECAGGTVLPIAADWPAADDVEPGHVTSLLVAREDGATLLVANLARHTRTLPLPSGFHARSWRVLDERTAPHAAIDAAAFRGTNVAEGSMLLELLPFATARIDGRLDQQ